MKLAFTDGRQYIADPRFMKTDVSYWLSDAYADQRRSLIGEEAVLPTRQMPTTAARSTCALPTKKAIWSRISRATSTASARASSFPDGASL